MLIIIIFRSSLKLGHVGSKTRLLGQQATQVSDLGPLWPSCFLFFFFVFCCFFFWMHYDTVKPNCSLFVSTVVFNIASVPIITLFRVSRKKTTIDTGEAQYKYVIKDR